VPVPQKSFHPAGKNLLKVSKITRYLADFQQAFAGWSVWYTVYLPHISIFFVFQDYIPFIKRLGFAGNCHYEGENIQSIISYIGLKLI